MDRDGQREELGRGSFGVTYAAHFRGKLHAVKLVKRPPPGHPDLASWPSDAAAFRREAELQYGLRDDGVVPVAGLAERLDERGEPKELALVIKLAVGGSLAHWLVGVGRAATRGERLRLLLGAARGLHYLHSHDPAIIHADIKPANVLLGEGGAAMLADLGLSRVRAAGDVARASLLGPRGTPVYMAPELRHGAALHTSCDIFSFGVMAFETITGEDILQAFTAAQAGGAAQGGDPITRLYQAVDAGVRPRAERVGDPALAALLTRAWARDPAHRPTSAELCGELERAAAAAVTLRPPPPGKHLVEPYPQGRALALLFVDEREACFPAICARLSSALVRCGYTVQHFEGRSMLQDVRRALAAAEPATLSRVIVSYNGHGCMSDAHPLGLVCGSTGRWAEFVRVAELQAVVDSLLPKGVPKLFILDCCYSDAGEGGRLPPAWKIADPAQDSVHDVAIFRAASEGHYSYYNRSAQWSLVTHMADMLDRSDGISLCELKLLVEEPMRAHMKGVIEPMLDLRMGRPFTFVHAQVVPPPAPQCTKACGRTATRGDGLCDSCRVPPQLPNASMTPSKVAELMRAGMQNPRVAEEGAKALRALSLRNGGEKPCVDAGAVPALVAALKAHPSVAAVAEQACGALRNIAYIPAGMDATVAAGAVPAVVAALKANLSEAAVVERACGMLYFIGVNSPHNKGAIAAAGAAPVLAAVFSDLAGNARAAAHGVLKLLGYNDSGSVPPPTLQCTKACGRAATREDGLCDSCSGQLQLPNASMTPAVVVQLLRAGGHNPRVAGAGARALNALSFPDGGRKSCVDAGAVSALVAALKAHPSVAAVAEKACGALQRITAFPADREAAVSAGAVPAVVAALKAHPSVAAVAERACGALQRITAITVIPACQEDAASAGAVPALVAALKAHPSVAAVAEQACGALWNLGSNSPNNKAAMVAAGAVPVLAAAFSAHTGDARAAAHSVLYSLGYNDNGSKA